LIKFVLDFYKIPYTVVVGYKDMPVDALLGIPDMSKLLNESKYKSISRSHLSINQGSLGRIYRYITFYRSAKGYTDREGLPYKIRKSCIDLWIRQINPPKRLLTTSVLRRTLSIQCEVNWDTHTAQDYFKLLKLSFADSDTALLFSCPNCSKTIMLTIRPQNHRY
jgi:hypothetical protein